MTETVPYPDNQAATDADHVKNQWEDLFLDDTRPNAYNGFVNRKDQFEELKWHYEVDTKSNFVAVKTSVNFGNTDIKKKQHKIQWMDSENDGLLPDNPYIVLSVERYECHHGPDRNKAKKNKPEAVPDHVYGKKRFLIQPTKKMNCPATIIAKEVIFFTDYKTSVSKWQREKISKDIKTGMMDDKKLNLKMDKRLVIKLPKKEEHKFHLQGEIEEISMPVDKRIVAKVEDYVTEGFISASCIRMLLDTFVRKELFAGQRSPSWTNRRFFPSQKDVSNLIYSTRLRAVKSKYDQENLAGCVEEWRRENPDDLIDFSPSDDTSRLLFIYQSRQQRRLLQRYGNEICFLDATYRTTKYSVPLFFLCVKTNMD